MNNGMSAIGTWRTSASALHCLFPGVKRTKSYYIGGMVSRRSRGRPLNAPAAFIHPCQPTSPNNRFSMAAFCQARTAFSAVLFIVLSWWPRNAPSAIQRLSPC